MSDKFSKSIRSKIMSHIRKTDTKPELRVRRFLHAHRFRFRVYDRRLPGCPDIVLRKHRAVVFVHGCFWHQHENCKLAKVPKSNRSYWKPKLRRNRERDRKNLAILRKDGWRVFVVWECQSDRFPTLIALVDKLGKRQI